jgi:nitrilase
MNMLRKEKTKSPVVRVALVQAAPVLFDLEKSVDKAVALIGEAARRQVDLILLPEAYLPGYPRGQDFGTLVGSRSSEGRELWKRYFENSLETGDAACRRLGKAAAAAGAYLAVGVTEQDPDTRGTLYCTLLYFDRQGNLAGKHRKLKPTGTERVIWGEGDGSTLTVLDTEIGRIGGLICWENYMPLARAALYRRGVQLYLAPTADSRDTWQASLIHIACEGRCFVLGCNQFVPRSVHEDALGPDAGLPEILCRGGSSVISPLGEVLAGPLYDQEGILYAELDLGETVRGKFDFDVAGHYARPDVFDLQIKDQPPLIRTGTPG